MGQPSIRRFIPLVLLLILVVVGVIYVASVSGQEAGPLRASGMVSAVEVAVAPEMSGRVVEVLAEEADFVEAGEVLFRQDDSLLQAQRQRASAASETARAALNTAQASLEAARAQYALTLSAARLQDLPMRQAEWSQSLPWVYTLPEWYFDRPEEIAAAEAEVEAAEQALAEARQDLEALLTQEERDELRSAEAALAEALVAYEVAQDVFDRASLARSPSDLLDEAEAARDTAHEALEDAQAAYDDVLVEEAQEEVLAARARLAVAHARREAALDRLAQLQVAQYSLLVQVAAAAVAQAEAAVEQARASVGQAEAEMNAMDVQLEKLVVRAPVAGVVLTRSLEPGEVVLAGAEVIVLGQMETLTITVYVPEDRYGQIRLGDVAAVTADSFPGVTFQATVSRIADEAEFTPRNVQTEEGRRTTVFAVVLSLEDPQGRLKPGMPADVTFSLPGEAE